ncbi:MAG: D-alanine--D-alanine ligase, partial [Bacteroidetes bacterium]|nr:D-alanine--D-alanine ligase [Bacteroidota bacterium]
MKKKIAVIAGGYSSEALISLQSADTVIEQLSSDDYDIYKILISKDSWECLHNNNTYTVNRDDFTVAIGDQIIKFDCVFNAIHGEPGEGGEIQKYFKEIGMPFTAS